VVLQEKARKGEVNFEQGVELEIAVEVVIAVREKVLELELELGQGLVGGSGTLLRLGWE